MESAALVSALEGLGSKLDTLTEVGRETNRRLDRTERVMRAGFHTLADLLGETNGRIDETNHRLGEANHRLDETNHRLDETNHRLGEINHRIDETNHRLGRLEGRFDNFVDVAGNETRAIRTDMARLDERVTALERRRKKS